MFQVARACYSDADTIIFDDPLSALDPEVGSKLFHECICEFMDGKTRLFVTNQLQYLRYCDKIVALGGGQIVEQGSFQTLMDDEKGEVRRMLEETGRVNADSKSVRPDKKIEEEEKDTGGKKKEKDALLTKEERMIGAVSWSVYKKYIKSGGGFWRFAIVYIGYCLSIGNGLATTSWVSYWTSDADYSRHSEAFYLCIFFGLSVSLGLVTFVRSFLLARFGVRASETLHHSLLDSILRAPQSFFDTTPLGRILSRFSKDLYSIDIELAEQLDFFLFCSLQVVRFLGRTNVCKTGPFLTLSFSYRWLLCLLFYLSLHGSGLLYCHSGLFILLCSTTFVKFHAKQSVWTVSVGPQSMLGFQRHFRGLVRFVHTAKGDVLLEILKRKLTKILVHITTTKMQTDGYRFDLRQ